MKILNFVLISTTFILNLSQIANAERTSPPLPKEQQQIYDLGCQAVGEGYCADLTYDLSLEFYQLIQLTEYLVSDDQFELVTELSWAPSIEEAMKFIEEGGSKDLADQFNQLIRFQVEIDQIRSIMSLKPTEYCDESELCHYMYFLVYLNNGHLLFFQWMP